MVELGFKSCCVDSELSATLPMPLHYIAVGVLAEEEEEVK